MGHPGGAAYPRGVENFTATDERGWKTITRVIDDTDYYVLILGGLYGSVDPTTGISWTQREYEYATSKKVPVLAFIREPSSTPGDRVERDAHKMALLQKFIEHVRGHHLCKPWRAADDLSAAVASALRNHIEDDEYDGHPRPGWIRGDTVPSLASLEEFARISSENARMKSVLEERRKEDLSPPVLQLVHGDEERPFQALSLERTILRSRDATAGPVVAAYLQKRSKTMWLELAVQNAGQTPARNAFADFRFPEARDIHLELVNPAKVSSTSHVTATARESHCYVDRRSTNTIRQRIKLIAPRSSEPLVMFGVEFSNAYPGQELSLSCLYTITDESGVSAQGQFIIRMKWASQVKEISVGSVASLPEPPLREE